VQQYAGAGGHKVGECKVQGGQGPGEGLQRKVNIYFTLFLVKDSLLTYSLVCLQTWAGEISESVKAT
jgi:hypothetical protein